MSKHTKDKLICWVIYSVGMLVTSINCIVSAYLIGSNLMEGELIEALLYVFFTCVFIYQANHFTHRHFESLKNIEKVNQLQKKLEEIIETANKNQKMKN